MSISRVGSEEAMSDTKTRLDWPPAGSVGVTVVKLSPSVVNTARAPFLLSSSDHANPFGRVGLPGSVSTTLVNAGR